MSRKLNARETTQWVKHLQEAVFFLVGVECRNDKKACFINVLRMFDGDVEKMPSIEKSLKRKGYLAPRNMINDLFKTQGDDALKDAPDRVVDALLDDNSKLCKELKNLFVDAYYKNAYTLIHAGVTHWEDIKKVVDLAKTVAPKVSMTPNA